MTFPMVSAIAAWAVSCNARVTNKGPADPVHFQPRGRVRLIKLAARHGRLLELHRSRGQWKQYLDYLGSLGLGMREGVFHGGGRETARELILCLLAHAGFQPNGTLAASETLLKALGDGDSRRLYSLLRQAYNDPN